MSDAREDVYESLGDILNQLWKTLKEKNREILEGLKTNEDVINEFKKDHADEIKQLNDKMKDSNINLTKDDILSRSIENINEYNKRFEKSNITVDKILDSMKDSIDEKDSSNQGILKQINELKEYNTSLKDDKEQLLDNLHLKQTPNVPTKGNILDYMVNMKFINDSDRERVQVGNKNELVIPDSQDNSKAKLAVLDEKEVKIFDRNILEDKSVQDNLLKEVSYEEVNAYRQYIDDKIVDDNYKELDGNMVKYETIIDNSHTKEGRKINSSMGLNRSAINNVNGQNINIYISESKNMNKARKMNKVSESKQEMDKSQDSITKETKTEKRQERTNEKEYEMER